MSVTIGITGIGGDIGFGILKSLKQSKYKKAKTIGMDINPYSVGLYKVDKSYILPFADSSAYIPQLTKVCNKEKIDVLFVSTEQELFRLSENRETFSRKTQTRLTVVSNKIIEIGLDKWKTYQFLKKNNFLFPKSILIENDLKKENQFIKDTGFPLILKSRMGRGAKNIYRINNLEELDFYRKKVHQPILQEYLRPNTEEYTCGIFADNNKIFVIIFKRELRFGLTFKAVVWGDKEIDKTCRKIAQSLDLKGSINIQLRKTERGPVVFEINPRYSSTASIRNRLGFLDVEWAIDTFLFNKKNIQYKPPPKGRVIIRYFEEFYVKEKIKEPAKFSNI